MDKVGPTIRAATSVLGDLIDVCPPAEAYKDALERMSRATVEMCLGGSKRGPTPAIAPSGTYQPGPPVPSHRQATRRGDEVEAKEAPMHAPQYGSVYQSAQPVSPRLAQPSPQHPTRMHQHSASRASSTDSYSQSAAAAAAAKTRRAQPIRFDADFFTSPPGIAHIPTPICTYSLQQHHGYAQSPTTPTEEMPFHHPSPAFAHPRQHHQQDMYSQSHSDMVIDPVLQAPYASPPSNSNNTVNWGNIDMTQFGIVPEAEMWGHNSWSEEGNAGQVDPFGGFFFGG